MNLRSKSQKRKGTWKQIVSLFLVLCMVVTMMPVTQMTANAEEVAVAGASGPVTVRAHFKNTADWESVNFYSWLDDKTQLVGAWPGTPAQKNEQNEGYYTYELVKADRNTNLNIIFNGSGAQTKDIQIKSKYFTGDVCDVWVTWNTKKRGYKCFL